MSLSIDEKSKIFPKNESEDYLRQSYDYLIQKGFEAVEMPVLQNANKILDTVGERSRSELFFVESDDIDANGLRYDFTLPIALHYLNNTQFEARPECKIMTKGYVFRRREGEAKSEFKQIGLEFIGQNERTKTDAECLATVLDMLKPIDIQNLHIEIADIGLSRAILDMPYIPPIKSGRLRSALRYREKFMRLLDGSLDQDQYKNDPLITIGHLQDSDAKRIVDDIFKLNNFKHTGLRSTEEITERFVKKSEEYREPKLEAHVAQILMRFYDLECKAVSATDKIRNLLSEINPNIDDYLQYYQRRLDIMQSFGVDISILNYGPLVKRKPEYYSGFMFSIDVNTDQGQVSLAGGGRYDDLFKVLGASDKISAVGAEIRPDNVVRFL